MASEDVIELGSSDDETEPAPKKKKPAPNAMVHFPGTLPGLVIKPAKPIIPPLQKVLAGGAVTITNVHTVNPPLKIHKPKTINPLKPKFPQKILHSVPILRPALNAQGNLSINPFSLVNNQQNTRFQVPKINLPPGITIKRSAAGPKISDVTGQNKKNNLKRKHAKVVQTVDLDDEDPVTSGVSPQWYLRPEQVEEVAMVTGDDGKVEVEINQIMLENNKEPDKSKFIEICIEDSPVKPAQSNRMDEIGVELSITIDDSPIKAVKEKPCLSGSDTETQKSTVPHSKKKLDYLKVEENECSKAKKNMVEIDLDKAESAEDSKDGGDNIKSMEKESKKTEGKKVKTVQITKEAKEKFKIDESQESDSSEFTPLYQRFIDLCFKLENSEDMKKIIETKVKPYYRQCPKEYVHSEEFIDMISSKIYALKAAPNKMYLYIKDVVDELKLQKKRAKAAEASNKENKETGEYFCTDDSEHDTKRRRQIRKLEKTIKKLHRAIQKLEEQEVEFDDEEDSVYLLTERYKERLIRVHAKFCQLTKTKLPSEPRIQIEARPGQPTGPAKRLEKWVNRKVPIGTPLPFPDFHDVLKCVREANDKDRLGWNEADIMEEARDLFIRCGKKLQRRRQENEWRIAASRLSQDVSTLDPAETSDVLKSRLEENRSLASKKELDLLNKYADKQNQLKLVAEEIGDKEAEESPVESEDEEVNDDGNALEDKQKRKKRLRRLLHEKTRKLSVENENISPNGPKDNEDVVEKVNDSDKNDNFTHKEENNKDIADVITESDSKAMSIDTESIPSNDESQNKGNNCDTNSIGSDIDELHLLQKLYSENELNSSTPESGSDSPIAISDTLDSDSETEKNKKQGSYDIISIENSSYSESEMTKDDNSKEPESNSVKHNNTDRLLLANIEIELSSASRGKLDEYDENILLASSSDEEKENTDTQTAISSYNSKTSHVIEAVIANNSERNRTISIEVMFNEKSTKGDITIIDQSNSQNFEDISERKNMIFDVVISRNKEVTDETNSSLSDVDLDNAEGNDVRNNMDAHDSKNSETLKEVEDSPQTLESTGSEIAQEDVKICDAENQILIDNVTSENYEKNCKDNSMSNDEYKGGSNKELNDILTNRISEQDDGNNEFKMLQKSDDEDKDNPLVSVKNISSDKDTMDPKVAENVNIKKSDDEFTDALIKQKTASEDFVELSGEKK